MIVTGCLIVFGGIGFFIPRRHLFKYMLLASLCISSLYFFFSPPKMYDLYRHYEVLHLIRRYDLGTILAGGTDTANRFLNDYESSSRVFLIYAYIISLFNVDELLPVVTGTIIYGVVAKIIIMSAEDIGGEIEDWKISFCFFFLLAMLDFRTISGLRNMLAYALFSYVLYWDLVRNAGKIKCFVAYYLLANIHSSVYILIIIRLLVYLNKVLPKWSIMAFVTASYSFLDVLYRFLMRFSHIPFIESVLSKMYAYGIAGGSKYILVRAAIHFLFIAVQFFTYLYTKKKKIIPSAFQKYGDFFLYAVLFTFGAIRQYDIFIRNNMLIYFSVYPFLICFLKESTGRTPFQLTAPESSRFGFTELFGYIMVFGIIALSLVMYYDGFYTHMDPYFHFGI